MIIVNIIGGLGNQMFEYAAGRAAAIRHHTTLKLDISNFSKKLETDRQYKLNVFNIVENFASQKEIAELKIGNNFFYKNFPRIARFLGLKEKKSFIHKDKTKNDISLVPDDSYMGGEWISHKFVEEIKPLLLREFTLKKPLGKQALLFLTKIQSCESVSLHVRRGDYLKPKHRKIYKLMQKSYYQKALKRIKNTGKIFVFSDDIKWCQKNLKFKPKPIIIGGEITDEEELILMSQCKNNIIANSAFSWWGAWLNQNPNKIVIAPKKWFKIKKMENPDLLPKSWIKI